MDMEPFFDAYRDVMPFLIPEGHEPTRERLQSAEDRAIFDDTTKCILCACCTASCPVFWSDGQYFGPLPSSGRTASSSIHAMLVPTCAWTSSTAKRCGVAAPPSTAPRPARVASRSPKPSQKSNVP